MKKLMILAVCCLFSTVAFAQDEHGPYYHCFYSGDDDDSFWEVRQEYVIPSGATRVYFDDSSMGPTCTTDPSWQLMEGFRAKYGFSEISIMGGGYTGFQYGVPLGDSVWIYINKESARGKTYTFALPGGGSNEVVIYVEP